MSNRYDPGDLEPVTAPEPRTLPSEHDRSRRSLLGRIVAPVAVALGVLVKFGAFGLKFFGIFLAVGGYALIWGWKFGVGVVLLILVHELGHYVEAKRLGLDPQLPVFIPFLGAYVALRNMRFDPWVNARVSLAGPVAGGIGALACLIVGRADGLRPAEGARLHGLPPQPDQPDPGRDPRRRPRAPLVARPSRGRRRCEPRHARGRRAAVVALVSLATAAALVVGMVVSHVPQDRL